MTSMGNLGPSANLSECGTTLCCKDSPNRHASEHAHKYLFGGWWRWTSMMETSTAVMFRA
jgi:hypothetical protein